MKASKTNNSNHCEDCPSRGEGVFCSLEKLVLDDLSAHKITNTYKKGQTLFVEGNPPYGIYCISSGNIKLTKMSNEGKDAIIRIAKGGDIIGHRSVFTEKFFSATATVLEDSKICFIDKKYILKLVQENPSVAVNIIGRLSRDLGASENKVASLYQKNVRERLAELLLLLKESHGIQENERILLDIKLTREEMASIIGTAQETLIRFLSELKEDGFISQEGKKIFITNEEGLIETAAIQY